MTPKVSILMSVYKEEKKFLVQSIESMLNQTFRDYEFILINDNPSDEELDQFLKKYAESDHRIKYYTNIQNIGLQETLIKGVELCTTDYIVRMDADDISYPTRIERQYKTIVDNGYDIVSVNYDNIDNTDEKLKIGYRWQTSKIINKDLLKKNQVAHSSIIMSKNTLIKIGSYRTVKYAEDYDLLLRIISSGGQIYNIAESLMAVRKNPDGISLSNKNEQIVSSIYVRKLFLERKKWGTDSFSDENQKQFLESYSKYINDDFNKYYNGRKKDHIYLLYLILTNKIYRDLFLIRVKLMF